MPRSQQPQRCLLAAKASPCGTCCAPLEVAGGVVYSSMELTVLVHFLMIAFVLY